MFAFSSVKKWSIFCVFCFFFLSHFPCRKKRILSKKKQKKDPFLALKTGPILLRNILGPVFNASLDQFLTLGFFVFCLCFLLLKPLFYSVFSKKNQILKKHKKEKKKTLFVSTPVLTALVKMSFFLFFFIFGFFLCNFQIFPRWILIDSQNSKNTRYEINKNKKQE